MENNYYKIRHLLSLETHFFFCKFKIKIDMNFNLKGLNALIQKAKDLVDNYFNADYVEINIDAF